MTLTPTENCTPGSTARTFYLTAVAYSLALVLAAFGSLVFSPHSVISAPSMDIDRMFFPFRAFVFEQIRLGQFPLWNPYLLGGMPTLGNFQYALLYPPGWLQAVLPNIAAINLLVALHLWMAGFFAATWARQRGVGLVGSLLAGTLFMFTGPLMSRVYGGHLTFLFVVSWTPLLMLCVDAILDGNRPAAACLGGAVAVAMQVLGGYPQPAYYTFMAVVVYVGLRLLRHPNRLRAVGLIAGMYALGAALSAAQLLPAMDAGREMLRGGDTPVQFSLSFSLPPENLLTLVMPHVFGDEFGAPYVGRNGVWETSLYIGTAGLALALLAAVGSRAWRDRALAITLIVVLLLALGVYTPLYRALLHILPGLSQFRAPARFGFVATLFASVLAGVGFDLLWQARRNLRGAIIGGAVAALFAGVALLVRPGVSDLWQGVLLRLAEAAQQWPAVVAPVDDALVRRSAEMASKQLFAAAFGFAQLAIVLALMTRWRRWAYVLPLLALGQVWTGSGPWWQTFHPYQRAPADWETPLSQLKSDDRVLITDGARLNLPAQLQIESVGGYDPSVSRRWADLIAPLIGVDPWYGAFDARYVTPSPVWSMLRVRTALPPERSFTSQPLPRVMLLQNYRVVEGPDQSLRAVHDSDFDPARLVILERDPIPQPTGGDSPGQVEVVAMSTDWIEIKADLNRSALLLVTDGYGGGWRVRPLTPGPQDSYEVLVADHALRAIPLARGSHHFMHEYRPASVRVGVTISLVSMVACAAACAVKLYRAVQRRRAT